MSRAYYSDPAALAANISLVDDELHIELPRYDENGWEYTDLLVPVSDRSFEYTSGGWTQEVTFLEDADGGVEFLRSRHYVATPVPAGAAPPWLDATATTAQPSPEVLAGEDLAFTGVRPR